jgi:ketopantoate reductase
MSAEIQASQAREITESNAEVERWYNNFKDELFERIKNAAIKGNNSTKLSVDILKCNMAQREYLMSKLISLGYSVEIKHNVLTISW